MVDTQAILAHFGLDIVAGTKKITKNLIFDLHFDALGCILDLLRELDGQDKYP